MWLRSPLQKSQKAFSKQMLGSGAGLKRGVAFVRGQPISALVIVLMWIAATRIFYMVLHDPMYGYANQFDMGRTAACLNLWPDFLGGPRDIAYFGAPIEKHRLVTLSAQGCYPSAEVMLDWVALRLDGVRRLLVGGTDVVDMRTIGLFKALLLIATACVVSHSFRSRPKVALTHALILMLVIADPLHTLYLNTLYGEFVAVFGAYAAIAGLAGLALDDERPSLSLGVFACGVLCLAFSRAQHVLLPLFFVLVLAALKFKRASGGPPARRGGWPLHWVVIGLALASLCSIAVNINFVARNPMYHDANRNNMFFGALLPATDNPEAVVRALELPPHCVGLANAGYWRMIERGMKGACPEALAMSPMRLVTVFATEPKALATLFGRGLALSSGWRIRYVGEVAQGDFAQVPEGPLGVSASIESITKQLGFVGFAIFWLVPVVAGLQCAAALVYRRRCARNDDANTKSGDTAPHVEWLMLFALAVVIGSVWVSALLGDGYSELARHVHLGVLAALASWTMLVLRTVRRAALLPTTITALIVTVAIVALRLLPLAVGALAEPHDDRALVSADAFTGWVIAPHRIVAVDIEQQGRRLHRAQVEPSASLARYYPMDDGMRVFEFAFSGAVLTHHIDSATPLRIYAVREDERRQLIDVRYPSVIPSVDQ